MAESKCRRTSNDAVSQSVQTRIEEYRLVTGGHGMGLPALVTSHFLEKRTAKKTAEAQATTEKQAFENAQSRFIPIKDLLKP